MKKVLIYTNRHRRPVLQEVYDISTKEKRDKVILHIFAKQSFWAIMTTDLEKEKADYENFKKLTDFQINRLPSSVQATVRTRRENVLSGDNWGFKQKEKRVKWYKRAKEEKHVASAYELLKACSGWGSGFSITCHTVEEIKAD